MPAPAARPRRAAASSSFTHLFQPINLGDDTDSHSENENTPAGPQQESDKKRGKRKAVYVPGEDDSGSEFEVEHRDEEDEDDEDDAATVVDDEEDDLASGGGGDSDGSGSTRRGKAPARGKGGRGGRRARPHVTPARNTETARVVVTTANPASAQSSGGGGSTAGRGRKGAQPKRRQGALPPAPVADPAPGPNRAQVPENHPPTAISGMYSFYGPLASTIPTRTLAARPPSPSASATPQSPTHTLLSECVPSRFGTRLKDRDVLPLMDSWVENPFGVEVPAVRDAAWHPGQWEPAPEPSSDEGGAQGADSRRWKERRRWGGWYPEVSIADESLQPIHERDLIHYLPTQSYPLRPQALHLPENEEGGGTTAGPGTAGAASVEPTQPVTADAPRMEMDLDLPQPPAEFYTPSASASAGAGATGGGAAPSGSRAGVGQPPEPPAAGSVQIRLGRLAASEARERDRDETALVLERFEAVRLDEYIPHKPGHLFNAGGAVRSVRWAPRADDYGGGGGGGGDGDGRGKEEEVEGDAEGREYLAVTTVSDPEAPLRHVRPAPGPSSSPTSNGDPAGPASGSRPRSLIQLWSVPSAPAREELHYETPGPGTGVPLSSAEESRAGAGDGSSSASGGGRSRRMKLEVGFGVEGDATACEWCPRGGRSGGEGEPAEAAAEEQEQEEVAASSAAAGRGKKKKADRGGKKQAGRARSRAADAMALDDDGDEEGAGTAGEGQPDTLGILAVILGDEGEIGVFVVPRPEQVRRRAARSDGVEAPGFVEVQPLFRLRRPDTTIVSIAWGGHDTIAAGCTDGSITVWHVAEAIRSNGRQAPSHPTHVFQAHAGVVRALLFLDSPPPLLSDRTQHDLDRSPTGIVSVGYDGTASLSDLRAPDGAVVNLFQQRTPINDVTYSALSGVIYVHDVEDRVKAIFLKPSALGTEGRIAVHQGSVWSLAASPHHGLVATTSADGTAVLSSGIRALRKRRIRGHYNQKIFRLDFKRETGELRMWDNLRTEHRVALDPTNIARTAKKQAAAEAADPEDTSSIAWALEQGVLSSAWHPNLNRCALLATGMACGLGRVDWLEGNEQAIAKSAVPAPAPAR